MSVKSDCCEADCNEMFGEQGHELTCQKCFQPCEPASSKPESDEEWACIRAGAIREITEGRTMSIVRQAISEALSEGRRREREERPVYQTLFEATDQLNAEFERREEAAAREAWANGWHYGFVSRDLPVGAEQMTFETWWKRRAGK